MIYSICLCSLDPLKYPSSSHYTKNWDKLAQEVGEEEKNEKKEGDAALNSLFQQIYSDGSDEVRRAMIKSFVSIQSTYFSHVSESFTHRYQTAWKYSNLVIS